MNPRRMVLGLRYLKDYDAYLPLQFTDKMKTGGLSFSYRLFFLIHLGWSQLWEALHWD